MTNAPPMAKERWPPGGRPRLSLVSSSEGIGGAFVVTQGGAMKLGLINSAWVQSGKGTAYGIRQTKAIGFDSVDIFADPLDTDARERKLIRTECEAAGLPVV